MSLPLGTPADAQLATKVAGTHWLIELDFATGAQYITTTPVDVRGPSGVTYKGLGRAVQVGAVTESEDTSAQKIEISIPLVDDAMLPLVVGGVPNYRGRRVRLYLQVFDAAFVPVTSRVLRWQGRMDPVNVQRQVQPTGPSRGRIVLPCVRSGMPRARNYQGLRHTDAQQQARFPGNLVLQYMQGLIEQPSLWLSKRFQELT